MDFLCPLDHLYVFWVKLSSFLYPLSIMTKRGRNYGEYVFFFFFFKVLHVRGRNTFLCKGEMCFILIGGVLTSLFLYTGLVTMFTYIVLIFDDVCLLHLPLHVLFLFSLYTHVFYILYAIYYFCLTLRCFDEFSSKYFRNIDCQSLLAINSLLAKFFKSLC